MGPLKTQPGWYQYSCKRAPLQVGWSCKGLMLRKYFYFSRQRLETPLERPRASTQIAWANKGKVISLVIMLVRPPHNSRKRLADVGHHGVNCLWQFIFPVKFNSQPRSSAYLRSDLTITSLIFTVSLAMPKGSSCHGAFWENSRARGLEKPQFCFQTSRFRA